MSDNPLTDFVNHLLASNCPTCHAADRANTTFVPHAVPCDDRWHQLPQGVDREGVASYVADLAVGAALAADVRTTAEPSSRRLFLVAVQQDNGTWLAMTGAVRPSNVEILEVTEPGEVHSLTVILRGGPPAQCHAGVDSLSNLAADLAAGGSGE